MCCDRAVIYTKVYKEHQNKPILLKRAIALRETLEKMPIFIWESELIAGHPASLPRSAEVFPEVNIGFISEIDEFETREYNRLIVPFSVKKQLLEMQPFWTGKTLHDRFSAIRPTEISMAIKAGLLSNPHEWSGLAHVSIDYSKILTKGINGILKEIELFQSDVPITDPDYSEKFVFYEAAKELCNGVVNFAERYRLLAEHMASVEINEARKKELYQIAKVLKNVPFNPAQNFREAIQAFWLVQLIPQIESNGFSISPGRFDQYMEPYLVRDLEREQITLDEAQELLDNLFLKFCEILRVDTRASAEVNAGYASGQNLVVGGINSEGLDSTNLLTAMCIISNYHVRLHQPNFTVRLHKGTPERLLKMIVESISCGNGMPQVLNDELIVTSLQEKGIPLIEARDYLPVGCDEITVAKHWGRCNGGYINFAKLVELTINDGYDLFNEQKAGLKQGYDNYHTFDEFMTAFNNQLRNAVRMQISEANLTDSIHKNLLPLPFLSLFIDDCLLKGRDVTEGGAHYNTTGIVGVGSATCADSLVAIERLVFKEQRIKLHELKKILINDYENQEELRQHILNKYPKFGNDIDEVDQLARDFTDVFFDELDKYRNYRNGQFWPALYSVSAQVGLGNSTSATPDGRHRSMPLSDGLTPMYGMDRKGPTASLSSVAKVALVRAPNGVIVNQRLTANLFNSEEGISKICMLLKSFVNINGFHWQFNIVDNKTLLMAQENPENFRGLVVRVAGYSAIFVELSKKAQDSIIDRYSANI